MKITWNLKTKLIFTSLGVGLIPMITTNLVSSVKTKKIMTMEAEKKAKLVGHAKSNEIAAFVNTDVGSLIDISDMPLTEEAIVEFTEAFLQYGSMKLSEDDIDKVRKFYLSEYRILFSEKNPNDTFNVDAWMKGFSNATFQAQHDFIAVNNFDFYKKN